MLDISIPELYEQTIRKNFWGIPGYESPKNSLPKILIVNNEKGKKRFGRSLSPKTEQSHKLFEETIKNAKALPGCNIYQNKLFFFPAPKSPQSEKKTRHNNEKKEIQNVKIIPGPDPNLLRIQDEKIQKEKEKKLLIKQIIAKRSFSPQNTFLNNEMFVAMQVPGPGHYFKSNTSHETYRKKLNKVESKIIKREKLNSTQKEDFRNYSPLKNDIFTFEKYKFDLEIRKNKENLGLSKKKEKCISENEMEIYKDKYSRHLFSPKNSPSPGPAAYQINLEWKSKLDQKKNHAKRNNIYDRIYKGPDFFKNFV